MLAWIWTYVRKYAVIMTVGLLLSACVCALNMVNPTISGSIVDKVIIGGQTELLVRFVLIMIASIVLKSIIRYCYQMAFEHASQNVIRNLRGDLYDKVQALDFTYYDKTKPGDVMTLMTSDLDAVRHFIAWVIYQAFETTMLLVFSVTVLASINVPFTLAMLSVSPFITYFAIRFARSVKPMHLRVRDQFARLNSMVQENIAGNRVVKAFVREDHELERFRVQNETYRDRNLASVAVRVKYVPLIDGLTGLLPVVLILVGGLMVIRGSLTLGQLVTFNGLMWAISNPLSQVGGLVNDFQKFRASGERLHELFLLKSRIQNPAHPVPIGLGGGQVGRASGRVEFRGVGFSYGGGETLRDIDFVAESGMTVGILGPTGSGKSTVAKLICRYYDATSGQVLLDGQDVRTLDLGELRRNAGMAMQDVFLFSDTIEGNIAFGRPDANMDDIRAAARLADADDFIQELPQGYDTIVGERGVGLSGGQRQRIALARLLLSDPPVMILDDTSSSVDVETDERIRASLRRISGRRTMFVIAHRISALASADLILVMQDGRIVDRGVHAELIARPGYYRDVWEHQSATGSVAHTAAAPVAAPIAGARTGEETPYGA